MAKDLTISGNTLTKILKIVGALILVALAILLITTAIDAATGDDDSQNPVIGHVDRDGWQSVVLASGQIYIGKLRPGVSEESFVDLQDPYFLREKPGDKKTPASREVAPVTEELVGPEARMQINVDQIVLVENLREDSPVASAVERLENADDSEG
jgi:hypothetical protein